MKHGRLIVAALVLVCVRGAECSAAEVDPKPPVVKQLKPINAPQPSKHERVTFHSAPKPLPQGAVTADWPTFMGPAHNGVITETKLLKKFPEGGPKIVWELATGNGYSSPTIQGDRLVYVHRVRDDVTVECLHPATGDKYWDFSYPTTYEDRYGYSNGPRASPVIDGDRVYVMGVEGRFLCLELKTGRVVWERNINRDFNVKQDFFGTVGTPLLQGDLLIVNVGGKDGPCVVGFDKATGKARWTAGKNKWGPSYASPVPATIHGQRRVFVFAGGDSEPSVGGLISLDPANGKVDFEFPWRSKKYESVNAMPPVVFGNQVFISATYRAGSALLKVKPDFSPTTVWTMSDREHNEDEDQLGIHWSMPIVKDGYLYGFDGRNEPDATMVCVDLKKGRVVWRDPHQWEEMITFNGEKQKATLSTLRGSLIHADGAFLCLGEFGHLMWLDLSPEGYKLISRSWLFGAQYSWAPPVISHGLCYISQNARDFLGGKQPRLICYDLRAEK